MHRIRMHRRRIAMRRRNRRRLAMRRRRNRRRRGRRNGRKKRSIQFPEQMEDLNMKRATKTQPSCPQIYTASTEGKFCFLTSTELMKSTSAQHYCNKHGGNLVAIETSGKQSAVQTFLQRNHFNKEKIWLSDIASLDGVKVWRISQKPVDFNKFENKQIPFDDTCILFDVSSGSWISQPCSDTGSWKRPEHHRALCEPTENQQMNTLVNNGLDRQKRDTAAIHSGKADEKNVFKSLSSNVNSAFAKMNTGLKKMFG
ncbi:uncharacterized protein LOC128209491 [Mya arenaria]|uniref:uncharacterized protein LOC128209491 n=1 Tax=Mya arenaria TaxID=6604 RepID=UPI0022E1999A|nr:uncharacterized protein LOC128209491 [Mya arenaria]